MVCDNIFDIYFTQIQNAMFDKLIHLVVIVIIADAVFGTIRALKEGKFNSCFGITGVIRKTGILFALFFMVLVDGLLQFNFIGFLPLDIRALLGVDVIGMADFFAILFLMYELMSLIKNMDLCGIYIPKKVKRVLNKVSTELTDTCDYNDMKQSGRDEINNKNEK